MRITAVTRHLCFFVIFYRFSRTQSENKHRLLKTSTTIMYYNCYYYTARTYTTYTYDTNTTGESRTFPDFFFWFFFLPQKGLVMFLFFYFFPINRTLYYYAYSRCSRFVGSTMEIILYYYLPMGEIAHIFVDTPPLLL